VRLVAFLLAFTMCGFSYHRTVSAQTDPCSLEAILLSFQAAALSESIDRWSSQYDTSDCDHNIRIGIDYLVRGYSTILSESSLPVLFNFDGTDVLPLTLPTNENSHIEYGWLLVTAEDGRFNCVPLGITVSDTFYAEMSMIPNTWDSLYGFCLGDSVTNQYHYFLMGDDEGENGYAFAFFENTTRLFRSRYSYEGQIGRDDTGTVALEAISGRYQLYVNDDGRDAMEINPHGNILGIAVYNFPCCIVELARIQVDSVLIRDQK